MLQKGDTPLSKTKLYNVWHNIKRRCYKKDYYRYPDWGGRGIKMCKKWKDDFVAFYVWAMANGYKEGLSIDRIDNDGNYEPSNCRWATAKEQGENKGHGKKEIIVRLGFFDIPLKQLAQDLCISNTALQSMLYRGWNIDKALLSLIKLRKDAKLHQKVQDLVQAQGH